MTSYKGNSSYTSLKKVRCYSCMQNYFSELFRRLCHLSREFGRAEDIFDY